MSFETMWKDVAAEAKKQRPDLKTYAIQTQVEGTTVVLLNARLPGDRYVWAQFEAKPDSNPRGKALEIEFGVRDLLESYDREVAA